MINKVLINLSLGFIFILSACDSTNPQVDSTPTVTLSPTATITQTSTPSITPLPTIPTFTPTFDVSTIVTVTPAQKAECPKVNEALTFNTTSNPNAPILYDEEEILDKLNKGLSPNNLLNEINTGISPFIISEDVTGDNLPDLLFRNFTVIGMFHIYTCSQGQYVIHSPEIGYFGYETRVIDIKDLNANNLPEVIIEHKGCSGNHCYSIFIFEWDGENFQTLNSNAKYGEGMDGLQEIKVEEENNMLPKIVMNGGIPALGSYILGPPWRYEIKVLSWNGNIYSLQSFSFSPAEFQFQAIQDADSLSLNGYYEESLQTYQESIFNTQLEWWTEQRSVDTIVLLGNEGYSVLGTPAPGSPDPSEYPSLASYAYYRIMLLQLVQNQETEANQTYETLLDTFGNDIYAKPYIEMATKFLEAYQVNQSMYAGCAAAIQYAVEHPEILIPLGSDYHGSQAKIYEPADVCPFR